jgi:hypothetical protein
MPKSAPERNPDFSFPILHNNLGITTTPKSTSLTTAMRTRWVLCQIWLQKGIKLPKKGFCQSNSKVQSRKHQHLYNSTCKPSQTWFCWQESCLYLHQTHVEHMNTKMWKSNFRALNECEGIFWKKHHVSILWRGWKHSIRNLFHTTE